VQPHNRAIRSFVRFCVDFVRRKDGQMAPFAFSGILVGYSLFMGSAIDMSNLWLHKYRVTTAAQAASQAGAADLIWVANEGTAKAVENFESSPSGFPLAVATGTGFTNPPLGTSLSGTCGGNTQIAMCAYASANMPSSNGLAVRWTVSNVRPPTTSYNPNGSGGFGLFTTQQTIPVTPPTTSNGVLPYLSVTVSEIVPTYLLSIIPTFHSPVTVGGSAVAGLVGGGTAAGPEEAITSECLFDDIVFDHNQWVVAGASPAQLRTTGAGTIGDGQESQNYVFFNCNDPASGGWVDQTGVSHPSNFLSTLSTVTVDDVAMRQYAGNQETSGGAAVVSSVVLASSPTQFTLQPCSSVTNPTVTGMIDWGITDYLVRSINETQPFLYEADTHSTFSPWRTQPPTWTGSPESLLPPTEASSLITNPDTSSQFAEPAQWFFGTGTGTGSEITGSSTTDSVAIINALSNNQSFGFGWCIQGNGQRDFIGSTAAEPGSMTIFYHEGGAMKVGLLSSN
jgi:hypothetical protein